MVIGLPAAAPVVLSVAVFPVPLMLPALAEYAYVSVLLSGLCAETVSVDATPDFTSRGLTAQLAVGGGNGLTVKLALQFTELFLFFSFSSVAVTENRVASGRETGSGDPERFRCYLLPGHRCCSSCK